MRSFRKLRSGAVSKNPAEAGSFSSVTSGIPTIGLYWRTSFLFAVFSYFSIQSAFYVFVIPLQSMPPIKLIIFSPVWWSVGVAQQLWWIFSCVCACISKQRTTSLALIKEYELADTSWLSTMLSFLSLSSKPRRVPPVCLLKSFASTHTRCRPNTVTWKQCSLGLILKAYGRLLYLH